MQVFRIGLMPPGHPIRLLKSSWFHMATVSVKGLIEEVTREFLRGSRANAWEIMAEDALRKDWEVFGFWKTQQASRGSLATCCWIKERCFRESSQWFSKVCSISGFVCSGAPNDCFLKNKISQSEKQILPRIIYYLSHLRTAENF